MTRVGDCRGATLLEFVIASAVATLLLAAALALLRLGTASWAAQQRAVEVQQQLRAALALLAEELAAAGRGQPPGERALVRMDPSEVQFRLDGRLVRYRLVPDGPRFRLMRTVDGGSNEVADQLLSLELRYLDAALQPVVPGRDPDLVQIRIAAGVAAAAGAARPPRREWETSVWLPNRS